MEFPDPVIEVAIEPKTKADQEKDGYWRWCVLGPGRSLFPASPPTRKGGQTILKGMGELHLEIKVDILKRHL